VGSSRRRIAYKASLDSPSSLPTVQHIFKLKAGVLRKMVTHSVAMTRPSYPRGAFLTGQRRCCLRENSQVRQGLISLEEPFNLLAAETSGASPPSATSSCHHIKLLCTKPFTAVQAVGPLSPAGLRCCDERQCNMWLAGAALGDGRPVESGPDLRDGVCAWRHALLEWVWRQHSCLHHCLSRVTCIYPAPWGGGKKPH
jgi:hypothetical protein